MDEGLSSPSAMDLYDGVMRAAAREDFFKKFFAQFGEECGMDAVGLLLPLFFLLRRRTFFFFFCNDFRKIFYLDHRN